jgi:putative transposase
MNFFASLERELLNRRRFKSQAEAKMAATKLIWLALRNITENWKNPPISWHAAKAQLAIQFGDRLVLSE